METEDFCEALDEAMTEDGWVQTIAFGDPAPVIMQKLISYINWLRSERRPDPMFDRFSSRKA